jgi:hypothetical protein
LTKLDVTLKEGSEVKEGRREGMEGRKIVKEGSEGMK